ncbi:MAG: ABC transporter ATP-binding protein [Chloroflexota bacterium]|nr:ABC transporter ATP-binding protein [Chloroflexota bacterium]
MEAISVAGLTKSYGHFSALRGVDLSVQQGCVYGLLGPNGAGKSTLIKALVGALRPTQGDVRVLDICPLRDRDRLRRSIGYMPQEPALYEDLSPRDNIGFFGAAQNTQDLHHRIEEVLRFTDLEDRADDPVRQFSGGMKRRVSLACALVHQPSVLLLDEPTAAVDPGLRARFWKTFRELAAAGVTLFVSTHLMDEALLCDEVAVLRQGRLLAADAPERLLERGRTRVTIHRGETVEECTIGGRPEDLAQTLHVYGLAADVRSVRVQPDTLETVLLDMIQKEAIE